MLTDINWRPSPKELRKFGLVVIIGAAIVAGFFYWIEWKRAALVWACIGAVVGPLGLTGTVLGLPLYWAWMGVAFVMGNIVGRVLLGFLFFGIVTPIGLIMRISGADPLELRGTHKTHWKAIEASKSHERQF